ncbi:uncharacterized protein LOC105192883 [Solenopsis invicta]|uniref:uncharacterized protein LOC105192883 n=1 Tax=Solenopsis invicta TaxID=13686 RepID=UPI0001FE99C9|nr:uncharacterized protein LOC105192883 [Solenopsis invicta]XP_039308917.1 uncharacterized protein LOC105192883 [Solenopsis invicta]
MKNTKVKNSRTCSEHFSDQSGLFDIAVRPMLQEGHEGELCSWLKEMSLIRTTCNCRNLDCKGRNLTWSPARIIDKYVWTCPNCTQKQPIRENSFFLGIKCDLKLCLQLILGWCQNIPCEDTASYLDVKQHVVRKTYERCDEVSSIYVRKHPDDWLLGGQGAILIVDEFPGGYMTEHQPDINSTKKRNNNSQTIICIAEAKTVPPRIWLHMIEAIPEPQKIDKLQTGDDKSNMVKEALEQITRHAASGSCIVANNRARCCNYESLQSLSIKYKIISVEQLQKYDPPGKSKLVNNLGTIWQTAIEVCEEVQEATHKTGSHIIARHLWRQKFGATPSTAFQDMLTHIAEYFQFS